VRSFPDEADPRAATLAAALRAAGLRLTQQRREVVREIAGSDEHPSVEAVYRRVHTRMPSISIDTVYRTLATLAELGLVARLGTGEGVLRYDANPAQHHHFVCRQCGRIRDVVDAGLDAVASGGARDLGTVETVHVQFRGVCRDCIERGVLP